MIRPRISFRCLPARHLVVAMVAGALCSRPCRAGNTGFVTVSGTQFRLNGRPHFFVGANFWQGMTLAMSSGQGGDRDRLERELDRMKAIGIRHLRIMAASEGPDSEPYRMIPALQSAPGIYNEAVFEGLDYLLKAMDERDMRAVMQLNNYWHWSGGMAQYVSWAEGSDIPYPPSYPENTGDWNTFMNYAARFYTNAQCQAWFQAHISTVILRTNSFTDTLYRDDPTIFAWELANEPRRYPAAWIDDTASYIKSVDGQHLVTTGSEGLAGAEDWLPGWQDRDFIPTHDGPDIDYATCHIWPQNWGWYDPEMPSTYTAAESNARAYLAAHLTDAETQLDKPLVLEEFGLARDYAAPLYDIHDPDATTTNRNRFYAALFADIETSACSTGAAAGQCFWVWAGEARPGDTTPQWMGDPPHETPGWYSVYDTDGTTLNLISNHAAVILALNEDYDGDGLPDTWELEQFGSIIESSGLPGQDWDGDSFADLHEFIAGTSATNACDYFVVHETALSANVHRPVIAWHSVSGRLYSIYSTTTITNPWAVVESFIDVPGTGGEMRFTNACPAQPARFFRVKIDMQP